MSNLVKIQVYLREEELRALHEVAHREERSVADLVREAIRRTWLGPAGGRPAGKKPKRKAKRKAEGKAESKPKGKAERKPKSKARAKAESATKG